MAYIDNTDTKKEMNDAMRGNAVSNIAPTKINDSVQPVININPKDYRRCNIVRGQTLGTSGTTTAIYTTPSDKDFYLCNYSLSIIKDATCDIASGAITASITVDGASRIIAGIAVLTTTAQNSVITVSFNSPIRLDRNTSVSLTGTFTVGSLQRTHSIVGYTVEP